VVNFIHEVSRRAGIGGVGGKVVLEVFGMNSKKQIPGGVAKAVAAERYVGARGLHCGTGSDPAEATAVGGEGPIAEPFDRMEIVDYEGCNWLLPVCCRFVAN